MAVIPEINIEAPKRVPFDDVIADTRADYSGATALMEIRNEPGGDGMPLASLAMSSNGGEGMVISYDAGYLGPDTGEVVGASLIRIIVNETTLEGIAYGADPAVPVEAFYDIHLSPSSGKKFLLCSGKFIIVPGVTL